LQCRKGYLLGSYRIATTREANSNWLTSFKSTLFGVLGRATMQFFVREYCTMIAAPVQCDVDGIPKGSHCVSVTPLR
jgi:hypothetical protein